MQHIEFEVIPDGSTRLLKVEAGQLDMVTLWTNDIPDPDELVSFSVDDSQSSHDFYT